MIKLIRVESHNAKVSLMIIIHFFLKSYKDQITVGKCHFKVDIFY